MNYSSVLIITYGRSGSTLFQGLLNSIDGCVVRGENYNFCYGLYSAYSSLIKTKNEFGSGGKVLEPASPWYGAQLINEESYLEDARHLVMRQLVADSAQQELQCIGFKEIRYLGSDLSVLDESGRPALHGYLDFLAKLFPNPAFLFLTRDHEQVTKSAWWKNSDPERVAAQLTSFEKAAERYRIGKKWTFAITYNDIVSKSPVLHKLFDFLGAPYEPERINSVLSTEHSYVAKDIKPKVERKTYMSKRVVIFEEPSIQQILIDQLPEKLEPSKPFSLKGVVLATAEASDKVQLVVRDSKGEHPVEWRLASPKMGEKYPDNPRAALSRFRASNLIMGDKPVELLVVYGDGTTKTLVRINRL